jgi:hypothetical protein
VIVAETKKYLWSGNIEASDEPEAAAVDFSSKPQFAEPALEKVAAGADESI